MTPTPPDFLRISGTIQAETAITALDTLGTNPGAKGTLETFLKIYHDVRENVPDAPDIFEVVMEGKHVAQTKADILSGLEVIVSRTDGTLADKIAAQALLEVMSE